MKLSLYWKIISSIQLTKKMPSKETPITIKHNISMWKMVKLNFIDFSVISLIPEHFMAWVQFSSTSYWYKLWGRIPNTMPAGDYYLTIYNSKILLELVFRFFFKDYNVSRFSGVKTVNFANSSVFGGKNRLLGGFLLVFGNLFL